MHSFFISFFADSKKNKRRTPKTLPDRFYRNEPDLEALKRYIENGHRHPVGVSQVERATLWRQAKKFSVQKGKLYYENRKTLFLYVETERARQKYMAEIHL